MSYYENWEKDSLRDEILSFLSGGHTVSELLTIVADAVEDSEAQ